MATLNRIHSVKVFVYSVFLCCSLHLSGAMNAYTQSVAIQHTVAPHWNGEIKTLLLSSRSAVASAFVLYNPLDTLTNPDDPWDDPWWPYPWPYPWPDPNWPPDPDNPNNPGYTNPGPTPGWNIYDPGPTPPPGNSSPPPGSLFPGPPQGSPSPPHSTPPGFGSPGNPGSGGGTPPGTIGGGGNPGGGSGGGNGGGGGGQPGTVAADFNVEIAYPADITGSKGSTKYAYVTSGAIAGEAIIYVEPQSSWNSTFSSLSVDIYNARGTQVRHDSHLTADPNNPTTPSFYYSPWWTADYAQPNGSYKVVVTKVVASGTMTTTLNVSVKNLIVSSAGVNMPNSGIVLWNPNNPAPVTLTATVDAAYKSGSIRAQAMLFDCDHQQVNSTLLVQTKSNVCGSAGPAQFQFDLTPSLQKLPLGVYFYKVYADATDSYGVIREGGDDQDCDKTSLLTMTSLSPVLLSDNGTTANYQINYVFKGEYSAGTRKAKLDVYDDATLALLRTIPLSTTVGRQLSVNLSLPSQQGVFLVASGTDLHINNKSGGDKPIMQVGHIDTYIAGFIHDAMSDGGLYDEGSQFKTALQKMGYHALTDVGDWYLKGSNITIGKMIAGLRHAKPGSSKPLKIVMFGGHGTDHGGMIRLSGDIDHMSITKLLVPTDTYHNNPNNVDYQTYFDGSTALTPGHPIKEFPALELRPMVEPTKDGSFNTLGNLDLVILTSCTAGADDFSPLGSEFASLQANCVLRVGANVSYLQCEWLFYDFLYKNLALKTMTIKAATAQAYKDAIARMNPQPELHGWGNGQADYHLEGHGQDTILKP